MAKHHLDDSTLLRYASGDLDEAFSVVVASHLAMCAECRRSVRAAEAIGGELLEMAGEAEMSVGSFDRLMRQLDDSGDTISIEKPVAEFKDAIGDVPAPLQKFIGPRLDRVSWRTIAPGVRKHGIDLSSATSSKLYMLHIAPGMAVPEHGHGGSEMTLILSGAYRDELGLFRPGDIADLDENVEHQPQVEPGAACICLVATESPTRFKDLLSRILQPLFGI